MTGRTPCQRPRRKEAVTHNILQRFVAVFVLKRQTKAMVATLQYCSNGVGGVGLGLYWSLNNHEITLWNFVRAK